MTEPTTVELFLAIDHEGSWHVGEDADDAAGNVMAPCRIVKLTVTLSLPVQTEVELIVPDEAGQTVTAEVA